MSRVLPLSFEVRKQKEIGLKPSNPAGLIGILGDAKPHQVTAGKCRFRWGFPTNQCNNPGGDWNPMWSVDPRNPFSLSIVGYANNPDFGRLEVVPKFVEKEKGLDEGTRNTQADKQIRELCKFKKKNGFFLQQVSTKKSYPRPKFG